MLKIKYKDLLYLYTVALHGRGKRRQLHPKVPLPTLPGLILRFVYCTFKNPKSGTKFKLVT